MYHRSDTFNKCLLLSHYGSPLQSPLLCRGSSALIKSLCNRRPPRPLMIHLSECQLLSPALTVFSCASDTPYKLINPYMLLQFLSPPGTHPVLHLSSDNFQNVFQMSVSPRRPSCCSLNMNMALILFHLVFFHVFQEYVILGSLRTWQKIRAVYKPLGSRPIKPSL